MEKVDKIYSSIDYIQAFRKQLKSKDYESTIIVAIKTADLFLKIVEAKQYKNLEELLHIVKIVGKMFISVDIMQFSVGNVVKRILHIINQEKGKVVLSVDKRKSIVTLNSLLTQNNLNKDDIYSSYNVYTNLINDESKEKINLHNERISVNINNLEDTTINNLSTSIKTNTTNFNNLGESVENIIEKINSLITTLELTSEEINKLSDEHITQDDIILTSNYSGQLLEFLIEASKTKTFHVIIAESLPSESGILMAKKLTKANIKTTIINDSAIFAVIPRVNKVIIGTRAIMANGGLISYNGVYNICLSAQTYAIPVLVISGTFKLTPMYPFDHETYNEQLSPDKVCSGIVDGNLRNIGFNSPAYDYIPPELITIFITDSGSQNPTYMYRLFNECFSQDDYFL